MEVEETLDKIFELFYRLSLNEDELLSRNISSIFFLMQEYYFNIINNFDQKTIFKTKPSLSKLTITEKIDLIEEFYKEYGFPYSINEAIINGSFNLTVQDYQEDIDVYDGRTNGFAKFENEHPNLSCEDYGTLYDTVSWVHELAHYYNMSPNQEPENLLLTESMSFTMTLLYMDFLRKKGFVEADEYIKRQFISNYLVIDNYYFCIMFLTVYNEVGHVDYDSYKLVLGETDKYNEYLADLFELFNEEELDSLLWHLLNSLRYIVADFISIYLYEEYKRDPSVIDKIIKYNEKIKHPTNIEDILSTIGLPEIDTGEFHDIVNKSLEEFTEEMKNIINKQKIIKKD